MPTIAALSPTTPQTLGLAIIRDGKLVDTYAYDLDDALDVRAIAFDVSWQKPNLVVYETGQKSPLLSALLRELQSTLNVVLVTPSKSPLPRRQAIREAKARVLERYDTLVDAAEGDAVSLAEMALRALPARESSRPRR
jgi:hypothetical protein